MSLLMASWIPDQRERKRAYRAAPAAPTRPRTAVGHSGESTHPPTPWAWRTAGMTKRQPKSATRVGVFMPGDRLLSQSGTNREISAQHSSRIGWVQVCIRLPGALQGARLSRPARAATACGGLRSPRDGTSDRACGGYPGRIPLRLRRRAGCGQRPRASGGRWGCSTPTSPQLRCGLCRGCA